MIFIIAISVIGFCAGAGVYFLIRRRRRGIARTATIMRVATPVGGSGIRQYGIIIATVAVAIAFLVLSMIGVEIKSSILIVMAGSLSAMYFTAISFWMENNPRRFETLLSRFGVVLQNGQLTDKQAKALKELRFLAVPFALFTAYLALIPSWRVFGYLLILAAIGLALTLISYWKGWESNVWRYIHRVTLVVCLGALMVFAGSVFLNESDIGGWMKQKVAEYWNNPKPAPSAPQIAKSVEASPAKKPLVEAPPPPPADPSEKLAVIPIPPQGYAPPVSPEPPLSTANTTANTDDDALAEAAEAALKAMEEAEKDGNMLSAPPIAPPANPAINRRDEHGRLKPLPPMKKGNGSRIRVIKVKIPNWVK